MISQQGHLYPVYISRAESPGDFTITVIGDPHAPAGDVQVHVVYPTWARATDEQGYLLLVRCFAAHLLAHADRYEAALTADTEGRAAR
jgi:hypothetical protein